MSDDQQFRFPCMELKPVNYGLWKKAEIMWVAISVVVAILARNTENYRGRYHDSQGDLDYDIDIVVI